MVGEKEEAVLVGPLFKVGQCDRRKREAGVVLLQIGSVQPVGVGAGRNKVVRRRKVGRKRMSLDVRVVNDKVSGDALAPERK